MSPKRWPARGCAPPLQCAPQRRRRTGSHASAHFLAPRSRPASAEARAPSPGSSVKYPVIDMPPAPPLPSEPEPDGIAKSAPRIAKYALSEGRAQLLPARAGPIRSLPSSLFPDDVTSSRSRRLPHRARPLCWPCLGRSFDVELLRPLTPCLPPSRRAAIRAFSHPLDLTTADAKAIPVIAAVIGASNTALDMPIRSRLAHAALDMGDAIDAIHLCGEERDLLSVRVEALLVAERLGEGEAVYRAPSRRSRCSRISDRRAAGGSEGRRRAETASNVGFATPPRACTAPSAPGEMRPPPRALRRNRQSESASRRCRRLDEEANHRRIITRLQKPSLFAKYRRKAGGGVLLFGPPSCGKACSPARPPASAKPASSTFPSST